jgi:hypothetical protein
MGMVRVPDSWNNESWDIHDSNTFEHFWCELGYALAERNEPNGLYRVVNSKKSDCTTQALEERVMIRQRLVRQWRFPVIGAFWQ